MKLSLIAAVASNGVIGMNGGIPWHIPEDMAYFKSVTMGHRVIMGRMTWLSFPIGLKGRQNVIVSRNLENFNSALLFNDDVIVDSVESALALPQWGEHEEVFCIGGAKLYEAMLPLASKLYLTEIWNEFDGDTYFPKFDINEWENISFTEPKEQCKPLKYYFSVYERKSPVLFPAS